MVVKCGSPVIDILVFSIFSFFFINIIDDCKSFCGKLTVNNSVVLEPSFVSFKLKNVITMLRTNGSVFHFTLSGLKILHLLITQVDDTRDLLVVNFLSVPSLLSVSRNGSPVLRKILVMGNDLLLISFLLADSSARSDNPVPEDSNTPENEDA